MRSRLNWVFVVLFVCAASLCDAGEPQATARAVVARDGAAVVPIKVVMSTKATFEGREMPSEERETEALGVVLDKTGLVVTSYFAVDPVGASAPKTRSPELDSEIKSVKLIGKDGTEQPLKVVLRDADLDLMFLRPEKPAGLPHVTLKPKPPELGLADPIIVVSRLGAVGDRREAVLISHVQAVIQKPRRLYVTETIGSMTALGCPVYTERGELAGLVVMRVAQEGTPGGVLGGLRSQILPAILPIADVMEDMAQVEKPEAEPVKKPEAEPTKKPETGPAKTPATEPVKKPETEPAKKP